MVLLLGNGYKDFIVTEIYSILSLNRLLILETVKKKFETRRKGDYSVISGLLRYGRSAPLHEIHIVPLLTEWLQEKPVGSLISSCVVF